MKENHMTKPAHTKGEIEASVCAELSGFEQKHMGRGPQSLEANLQGNMLVIRMQGVLTAAEKRLVSVESTERGRDLVKQMRRQLLESARPILAETIERITGVSVRSMHHDVSTVTDEKLIVFTLVDEPNCGDQERR